MKYDVYIMLHFVYNRFILDRPISIKGLYEGYPTDRGLLF